MSRWDFSLRCTCGTFYFGANCTQSPLLSFPASLRQTSLLSHRGRSWVLSPELSIEGVSLGWGPFETWGRKQNNNNKFISSAPGRCLPGNPSRRCKPWGPGAALGPSHPASGSPGGGSGSSPLSAAPVPDFRGSCGTGREGAPECAWGFEWESRLWRRRPIPSCPSPGPAGWPAEGSFWGAFLLRHRVLELESQAPVTHQASASQTSEEPISRAVRAGPVSARGPSGWGTRKGERTGPTGQLCERAGGSSPSAVPAGRALWTLWGAERVGVPQTPGGERDHGWAWGPVI